MWRRKRSRIVLDIFLIVLILAVAAAMFVGYMKMSAQQALQDQELVDLANRTKEQTQILKEESNEALEAAYKQDIDTLAQYLPGIVCWGDVLTEGTASGVSYPKTLQNLIDTYLVDPYDFRSTIENSYQYTRIDWDQYTISIPVVNMGTGKESTQTILGRSGAEPYVISKDFTIPSDCSAVEISFRGYDGTNVKPLINGDGGVNPVTINGIEGTVTADPASYSENSTGKYYFTRTAPGSETAVEAKTPIITNAANLYRDYIHVIFVGSFGNYESAQTLASQVKSFVNRQLSNTDRFIVIGIFAGPESSSRFYEQFASLMTQEYGDRFLNFRKYLLNEALGDLGMTASRNDSGYIQASQIPPSLLVPGSKTELLAPLYSRLGQLVFERLDSLGYFDEIREELEIPSIEEVNALLAAAEKNR